MQEKNKKSYRQYLKSDHWLNLKKEKQEFVRHKSDCLFCTERFDQLDTHHLFYRDDWENSKPEDLIRICKKCHKTVHFLLESRKLILDEKLKFDRNYAINKQKAAVRKYLGIQMLRKRSTPRRINLGEYTYIENLNKHLKSHLGSEENRKRLAVLEENLPKERAFEVLCEEIKFCKKLKDQSELSDEVLKKYGKTKEQKKFYNEKDEFLKDKNKMLGYLHKFVQEKKGYLKILVLENKDVVEIIRLGLKSRFKKEEIEKCLIKHEILTNKA